MNHPTRLAIGALLLVALSSFTPVIAQTSAGGDDPYLWLEQDTAKAALEWARAHDSATMKVFGNDPNFVSCTSEALAILNARERIPYGNLQGKYVYNFWQDQDHPRGYLRRTSIQDYMQKTPQWETVLDIDQLNKTEGKSWVYHGFDALPPDNIHALVTLSAGGSDAAVVREFDLAAKDWVKDGFFVPEAKSSVGWYNLDTLIVGTDFGPGSLTTSGYPRIVKLWKRGTPLDQATTIFEGDSADVDVSGSMDYRPEERLFTIRRSQTTWSGHDWLVGADMKQIPIPLPADARIWTHFKGYLIVMLYSEWLGIPEGSVVAIKTADIGASDLKSRVSTLYTPDQKTTVQGIADLKDYLVITLLQNVRGRVIYLTLDDSGAQPKWSTGDVKLPTFGTVGITSRDPYSNAILVSFQDFLTPPTLYYLEDPKATPVEIKSLPAQFDSKGLKISQFEAASKDGTMIPYFLVGKADLAADGKNPTILYGYGGFRASMTPSYSGTIGKLWLQNGGVYVLANIRGGGEFGPRWHKAALLKNRQKAFDDFIAVAEDLIKRKITSPQHLGCMGGSNGGLLVGVAFTQRPDLFNAVVCQVPLLDMLRYTKLPPGASWAGEYGDPDSADMRAYIATYSPYQNVKPGVKYPQVLFQTSTKDDRVHPAHARKMTAKMEAMGDKVFFYEETEGGHGAAADNLHRAQFVALEYAYLRKMLIQ